MVADVLLLSPPADTCLYTVPTSHMSLFDLNESRRACVCYWIGFLVNINQKFRPLKKKKKSLVDEKACEIGARWIIFAVKLTLYYVITHVHFTKWREILTFKN